jgi:hypothetical protein
MLDRARDCAAITLPHLLPADGFDETQQLPVPWQAHGARCIRNLAGRLVITLFPPGLPYFKFGVADYLREADQELKANWETIRDALRIIEKSVTTFFDTHGWRTACVHAAEALVGVGNILLHVDPTSNLMRTIRYDRFTVKRDPMGVPYEIIVRETKTFGTLPPELQEMLQSTRRTDKYESTAPIDIFTAVYWDSESGQWEQRQEVCGIMWEGGTASYPPENLPWLPLRFTAMSGEDYGRGLVELTIGDWRSLEANYININEIGAAMAKIVPLVNPAGLTSMRDFTRSANGVPIPGRADDITFAQINKISDAQFMLSVIQELTQRLSHTFLLNTAIQRPGERVTAEEIRFMAQELEYAFGGTYSLLAEEWQLRLTKMILRLLAKDSLFPRIPDALQPQVITGIAGLGRDTEMSSLDAFSQRAAMLDPQGATVKRPQVLRKVADASGLVPSEVLKTDQEIQQEMQQAQMAQMAQQVAPEIARGVMDPNNPMNAGGVEPNVG